MVPWTFFVAVAKWSNKYSYKDWVVEKEGNYRDRSEKKKRYLESCMEDTPGSQHRADNEKIKYEITPGFVLCFIARLYFKVVTLEEIKYMGVVCGNPLCVAYLLRTS